VSKPVEFTTASALLDAENCARFDDGIARARARAAAEGGVHMTAIWCRETGFAAAAIVGADGAERVTLLGPLDRDEAAEWLQAAAAQKFSGAKH